MDVLILNRAEVEASLDLPTLLGALRDGFEALTTRAIVRPRPQRAADARRGLPARHARTPARRADDGQGRHGLRGQPRARSPARHLATIGLYDAATGACRAFMDGTYITAIRTSAAAAVACDALASADATDARDHRRRRPGRAPPAARSRWCATSTRSGQLAVPRGRRARRRAASPRTGRRGRGDRGPRRRRRRPRHPRRPARDRARVARARRSRELGRLSPARRRASARARSRRPPVRGDPRGLRADPDRLRGAQRADPASATEIGEVLLGRRPVA